MSNIDRYAHLLSVSDPLREPAIRAAIQALQLAPASRGLDAGCGIGLQSLLLAEAVAPAGQVVGLDASPEFLAQARLIAHEAGLSERVSFRVGDINELPFDDDSFDWLWSADCAGYPAKAPLRLIRELARVVKPGGTVSILVWSSQMLLPGHPLLEARLNATTVGIAPFTPRMSPDQHHLCALGWFRAAGLEHCAAQTFVRDVHAPLGDEIREALIALFQMRWGGAGSEVAPEDWSAYQRLCSPDSPGFILDRPDYYAFFTESLFRGQVPG